MTPHTLVLGLGNDLVSDDGFGPVVAERCRVEMASSPDVRVETAAAGGLRLLDILAGFRLAILVDVVRTGQHPPGTLLEWPVAGAAPAWTLGSSHDLDLASTIALGRQLGMALPETIRLLVAEAEDLETLHEGLTDPLARAVPRAVATVYDWVRQEGEGSEGGRST